MTPGIIQELEDVKSKLKIVLNLCNRIVIKETGPFELPAIKTHLQQSIDLLKKVLGPRTTFNASDPFFGRE
jgi:hypothetical protein